MIRCKVLSHSSKLPKYTQVRKLLFIGAQIGEENDYADKVVKVRNDGAVQITLKIILKLTRLVPSRQHRRNNSSLAIPSCTAPPRGLGGGIAIDDHVILAGVAVGTGIYAL
jgi:hypothetical protein